MHVSLNSRLASWKHVEIYCWQLAKSFSSSANVHQALESKLSQLLHSCSHFSEVSIAMTKPQEKIFFCEKTLAPLCVYSSFKLSTSLLFPLTSPTLQCGVISKKLRQLIQSRSLLLPPPFPTSSTTSQLLFNVFSSLSVCIAQAFVSYSKHTLCHIFDIDNRDLLRWSDNYGLSLVIPPNISARSNSWYLFCKGNVDISINRKIK